MQQFCTYGSVRGALGNWRPYRDVGALCSKKWGQEAVKDSRNVYILERLRRDMMIHVATGDPAATRA